MNKYDFDFLRMEDVLYDILGIADPTNIDSLKMQIRSNLMSLQDSLIKKNNGVSDANIRAIEKQLENIEAEENLDKVLRECVTMRYLTLLSLETKVRQDDSYEIKSQKQARRSELFAISELVNSVESLIDFIKNREMLMKYIDSKSRIIPYSTEAADSSSSSGYPQMKIDIQFSTKPKGFPDEYGQVLEEAGIYIYKFGELIYSTLPDDQGNYTQELTRKNFIGVIKKNEFGELKKYTVLMDELSRKVPPEFYRDVLFSDMLLRNAKNNFNYLGVPAPFFDDSWYGYKVEFDGVGVEDILRAMYFEKHPDLVKIQSNVSRVKYVSDAFELMQEKMEKALKELFEPEDKGVIIGDD